MLVFYCCFFFFSSRRRHTRYIGDWSSDVCSSDLGSPPMLSVDRGGRLYLNIGGDPQAALDEDTVEVRATAALRRNPDVQVLVKADSAVAYGRVVQAMVILQRAGARKVGFITEPLPQRARRGS